MYWSRRAFCALSVVVSLNPALMHAGAIVALTRAQLQGKQIFFFHDYHYMGDNTINIGDHHFRVGDVVDVQRPAFERFFIDMLAAFNYKPMVYLEWRDLLSQNYYDLVSAYSAKDNYVGKRLSKWLAHKDFFQQQLGWSYVQPKNTDPIRQAVSGIASCDPRTQADDDMFETFYLVTKLLDAQRRASKDASATPGQLLAQDAEFAAAFDQYHARGIGQRSAVFTSYLTDFEQRLATAFKRIESLITTDIAAQIHHEYCRVMEYMHHEWKWIVKHAAVNDFFAVLAAYSQEHNAATLDALFQALLDGQTLLVDVQLIEQLITADHTVSLVYCGGDHAQRIAQWIEQLGGTSTTLEIGKDENLLDADALHQALRILLPELETHATSYDLLYEIYSTQLLTNGTGESEGAPCTLLHRAAQDGNQQLVQFLVETLDADLTVCDAQDMSAADYARASGHLDLVTYLSAGQ